MPALHSSHLVDAYRLARSGDRLKCHRAQYIDILRDCDICVNDPLSKNKMKLIPQYRTILNEKDLGCCRLGENLA